MPEQPPSLVLDELDMKARILRICVEKLLAQSLEQTNGTPYGGALPVRSWVRLPRGVCATCGSGDTPGHICVR